MDPEFERLAAAFEAIAGALASIARTMELEHQKLYPSAKEPRDIQLTRVKTDEEKALEEGGLDAPIEDIYDWLEDNPRTAEWDREHSEEERARTASSTSGNTRETQSGSNGTGKRSKDHSDF